MRVLMIGDVVSDVGCEQLRRVLPGFLSDDLARSMHDLSALYGRLGSSEK